MSKLAFAEDFFPSKYWHLLTRLEKLTGYWPYQNKIKNTLIQSFHMISLLLIMFAFVARVPGERKLQNDAIVMEASVGAMTAYVLMIKLFILMVNQKSKKLLYEHVVSHWRNVFLKSEKSILNRYANDGYKMGVTYMVSIALACILFNVRLGNMYIKYWLSENRTYLKKQPLYYGEYFVDQDKYFYEIVIFNIIATLSGYIVNCAHDFAFIMTIQYVSSSFKIIVTRLNEISNIIEEADYGLIDFTTADNKAYDLIITAIDLHRVTLRTVTYIEKVFNLSWFFAISTNVMILGPGLVIIMHMKSIEERMPYILAVVLYFFHLFAIFWPGQVIINSSSTVYYACWNCQWYRLSRRSQFLIRIMMLRSYKSCILTGAKIFILNLESFTKVFQTALSFFSVFSNIR